MADEQIVTSIVAKADLSSLVSEVHRASASLQQLQRELLASNKAISSSTKLANNLFRDTLTGSGQFSSHFVNLNSDVDKFGKNLDAGRLKLKNYFSTFREHTTTQKGMIRELAKEQVMLQNSVLQPLGRNAQGLMQYNVMIPRGLDAVANSGKLARMEMQIMNRALSEGAGSLINWGKNTQWAGRQLTVGLTVPLTMFGAAAGKAFKEADQELVRLTKVYGGLAATSASDLKAIREEVVETAKTLSKTMGASFKDTIALGADIAATGQTGNELLGSIAETTRLAILGEVDRQDAMKATLSIQTAFKQNTQELTESINFLNAVENQTSTTLNDLVEAIPKAGPVIQQLGGDVKDLALYLTAMREGGISASEGANALKSGLASLINPTKQTVGMMSDFGIDVMGMVAKNTGDTTGLLMDLQKALDSLDPLSKARAMEQMFGKFQFARMSALLNNLGKQGSQTLQVLDLMKASTAELAEVASRELKMVTESASGKYKRAIEGLKAELADVGEEFLGVATKLIGAATKILDFFTKLPDPIKKGLTFLAGFTALVGPLIMLTGLLANFFGYITKGVVQLRAFFMKANGWKMLTPEIIAAEKAALLVENAFYSDAAAAQVLHNALQKLVLDYQNLQAASMKNAVPVNGGVSTVAGAPVMIGGRRVVDPNDPYVGDPNTRAMSHINPRDPNKPATIFGGVPGAIPVNRGISRTPQMYMHDRLPNIEGLTSVKGISTGIVPGEAAKFHALMATLGMQTEQEVAALKKTIMMGGTVSRELLDTFDDILPITQRFADSAATQSGLIVQQMRSAEITVDQAKARILALNAQIESEMGSAVGLYAAGRGRTLDLTRAPMMDQPVVDANGQFTLRDLYKKKTNAAVMTEFGRLRGIRTFGAPYSMQTTRMPKFNTGGEVESFGPNKTVVSGPSSIGYDDRLGSVPLGGYVLNQAASMDPANAALVAMAPSTYLNNGGSITAALTPREVVFGPQIQRMPELYAAVDAANSGYNFGGQIMNGISGYGKENPKGINKAEFKRQMREYLAFIHNPRYEDDIRVRMIMLDAAELTGSAGIPINKAIKIATSNFDLAKSRSGGSLEKFIELRVKQVKGLENAKGPNGKLKYPGLKLQNSSDTRHPQSTALNSHLNAVKASMLGDKSFSGVTDLIQRITPTSGLTLGKHPVPRLEGNVRAHLIRNGNIVDDAGNPYGTRGHMGVAAVMPQSINSVMNTLQNIGISPDILSLTSADARKNLEIALKNVGLSDFATVDDIFTALQDDGLFKSKSQIESGKVVRANRKQNSALSMLVEAAASRKKWFVMGRPPLLMLRNKGGVIPGGSISAGRSSYGVVPPLSARLEAIRLAQQARYAEKREADMIKYPWIKEAVAGRDRGSSISPLLKLLAPGKQLDILEQAREMSKATATGSFKDLPPVKYGHMVAPSSGMSFPIPGVSGLYKDSEGRLKFFKGVPNEISAKAEVYGTRMAREVFGLDAPEQTIKTILNPLDPSGKTKLLGVESPYDKTFTKGGTVFTEDEMIRQTIASLAMNNKDLSPSNVFGNVLADVGAAGVFAKASRNTEFAKTLPSMGEQAMINLLGVKGGARKDFAVNTSHLAGSMTAKQYERKMKTAMKKIHPKLIKFVATLPREDRAPYIKLLQRFEDGMEQTDFKTLHGVHVAAKRNSGGPIGGGSIQRGRYAYGAKNKKGSQRSGNPAKRAEEERLRAARTASYNAPSASGYTASGNPQMQVVQVPYVGGSGVSGNAFGAVATAQSQQTIDILRLAQIGQLPAAVSRSFKSLTDSIKLGTVGLRYGIATSGTHINSAYRDFAKQQVSSARLNASFLSNWVKTNTRDIKDGILRNQARSTFAAYPGANYLMGPGQIMPVSMSGPGMVGDWQETGQDGTKSRKVGTFGYRKREYMDADGYIHDKKSAQAAGLDTKIRGGMGFGAQMGIGMAGNMGGMYMMQQEKVNILGMETSGMNAGLGIMAASTIIPMIQWKTVGHSIATTTKNTMAAIKAAKGFKDGISAVGAQLGKYIKILKGVGVVLSVAFIGFDWWKKYNNAQQDAAMSLGITKDGAKQAGIEYFNLNNYLTEYIEKQKLANAAAQGGKNSSIGMPGIPQSIEDMKKAKEEGAALKDLIESINRTSSTGELQTLINNQKAQFIAGGVSVEQANRMIYGAIANSEKASDAYTLLANNGFTAIVDKATAAEFAVKNLLETLERDPKTGASKGSFAYNLVVKQPAMFSKEWREETSGFDKAWDMTLFGLIDKYKNAFADTNAYKKGVISGLESVINTFDSSTKALIGTKNETGEVIDEYEAYQITLANLEKNMPNFNAALGEETFKIIQDMSPELAKITNKFDSIKSILAKIKLSTSGIGLDLKYLDGALAIKLAGFQAAVDEGIEGLTKAAGEGSTFGSVGSVLKKLQKSIAATSAASQKAAAATQKNIQEELKLIAKKISLIEDEKNKKLESLRATQDASNYALELQKLQIEYADAVSRGDQAGAARARLDIDQLTKNRQLALTQKAIEDEAARLKAIEQKKIDAKQAAADAAAASYQGSVDNASSASKIADVIQGFKDTYDDITTARITNSVLPDSEAKREAESALLLRLNELLKQIGVAGTGKSQTAEEIRKAFSDYFNKDGTVKKLYIERAGLPEVTSKGPVPTTVTTLNKDTLSIFDRDIAAVTKFADQITGGSGYSIKKMTQEIVAALKRSVNAPASTKDVLGSDILLPLLKPSDYEKLKAYAERRGYKSGQKFTLENSNGVIQKFVVNPNGSVTYEGVSKTGPVYASGGEVRGPGTGTSDSIPAMLSHGEYVVKASSVAKYGVRTLDAINTQKFHKGGPVHAHLLDGTHPPSEISLGDNRYVSVYPTGTVWKPRPDLDRKDYKTEKEWLAAYYPKVRTDIFLTPPTKDYGIDKIKSPMGSLQRFLDIARSQIGAGHSYRLHTQDNPTAAKGNTPGMDDGMSDVNKFTIWGKKKFGLPSDVSWWCGSFVAWVAEKAGVEISDKMHSAWQATQQYKKKGLFNDLNKKNNYKNIKVGDLAWFDYARIPEDGGVGRRDGVPDHASIVSRVGKDVVDVIGWFGDDAVKQIGYYLKDPDLYGSVRPEFKKPAPKVITDTTPLSTATTPNQSSDTSTALSPTPTPAPTGFAQGGLAALPRLKKKIFESFPKKQYPTRNPGGMGIDKSTPPLIGSGASAYFGGLLGGGGGMMVGYHDGGSVHPHPHDASLPRLKKKIFESFPKKKYPTRNPGGMGIDKSTPPLIGSGASAYFGGLLGGGGGMMVGYHDGGYVHPHPHDALTNTLIQAPPKGTTAYAKYAYEMARRGGAAKIAAKLTKPIKTDAGPAYEFLQDGAVGYSRARKYTYEDAGLGSANQVESQILSDLYKTAMRAKIVEMNAKRFHLGGPVGHNHKYGEPTPVGKPWYKKAGNFVAEAVKETGRSAEWLAHLNWQFMYGNKSPYGFAANKLTGTTLPEPKFLSKNNQETYDLIAAMRAAGMNSEANKTFAMKTGMSGLNVGSLFVGGALGSGLARTAVSAYGAAKFGVPGMGTLLPTGSLTYGAKAGLGSASNLASSAYLSATKALTPKTAYAMTPEENAALGFAKPKDILQYGDLKTLEAYGARPRLYADAMAKVLDKVRFGEDAGTFYRALSIHDLAALAGYVRIPNPRLKSMTMEERINAARESKFAGYQYTDETVEAPWSDLAKSWKYNLDKTIKYPDPSSEEAMPFMDLQMAMKPGDYWRPDVLKSVTRDLDFAKEFAAQGGSSGGMNNAIAKILVDSSVKGLANFRDVIPGYNAHAKVPGYTEGAIAPFTKYVLDSVNKNAHSFVDKDGISTMIDEYVLKAVETARYAPFLDKSATFIHPWGKVAGEFASPSGKFPGPQLLPIVKKDTASSALIANASTMANRSLVPPSMRSSKASKTILRNLQKKAMEFAELRKATLPEMVLDGPNMFADAPTSFFSSPGTDLSRAYNYYWGEAWEILNKNSDPVIKDVSKEYFMTMLGLMGKGQISRAESRETVSTEFSRAANKAYAQAHGLDPNQPLAMYKATEAHSKLGGYWSLSSKMAAHYASDAHLNLTGDKAGSAIGGSNAGLYKIDVLPEQVPTPISIGGMYDEFTATLPPELIKTLGGGTRIALGGKKFTVRGDKRGTPGPQRANTADEFYSVVRGAPLPPGMGQHTLETLMKTQLHSRNLWGMDSYNDTFKKLLEFGTIVRKFANGGAVGFHTGGPVGHKHNNPNVGKIITGPNGGQFDFTQVTYSPATKYPTSGPNAFINESTGEAMQPMSKEEYKAYQKERLEYNKAYKISHAAKVEEYIKTLDNRPSRTILAERLGHGEMNMGGNALGRLGVPMFENGINMVPANMLALLHKNEAVIPANMNPFNPNAAAAVSGSVYNINVELNGTNVTAQDVATQIHKEMRLKEMAAGVNRRVGNG